MKRLSDKFIRRFAIFLSLFAFSLLGAVVGLFVGLSGSDAVVLSAVLPAVLTLVGGFFVFKSEDMEFKSVKVRKEKRKDLNIRANGKRKDSNRAIVTSLSVVLFLLFLVQGVREGTSIRANAEIRSAIEKQDFHLLLLEYCAINKPRINKVRDELNLPPLKAETIETICGLR